MNNNENDALSTRKGRPVKIDYDSDKFYSTIYNLALQGATNDEIASGLAETFGVELGRKTFGYMVNGKYHRWSEELNEKRGERIRETLDNARLGLNRIVRGRFLKVALGGIKVKSTTVVRRKLRIDGVYTDDEEIQTSETTSETAPNASALQTWLYHYDPEWRKVQKGEDDNGEVKKATKGLNIESWIEKEMEESE